MNSKHIRSLVVVLASSALMISMMPLAAMADNPVPATTSISPNSTFVGSSSLTITVNGSNFVSGSLINFNGSSRSTTYVSSTQLTAAIPASDLTTVGMFNITVTNPAPGGGISNTQVFTVGNLVATIAFISPSSVPAGSTGFTLNVSGTNFMTSSVVNFNGSARATTYVSSTQLSAIIPASDVVNPGNFDITVTNPSPGGGVSFAKTLAVTGNNPIPVLTSMSSLSTAVGGTSFLLTVYGSGFVPGSVVAFNGIPKTTTFVSSGQLTAVISASDIAMTGDYVINIVSPAPGGGTSGNMIFTVNPTSGTPVLPNTGFGPIEPTSGTSEWAMIVMAMMSALILSITLVVFKVKNAWAGK